MRAHSHLVDDGGIGTQVHTGLQVRGAADIGVRHQGAEVFQYGIMPNSTAQVKQHVLAQCNIGGQDAALADDTARPDLQLLIRRASHAGMYEGGKRQRWRGKLPYYCGPILAVAYRYGHV
jgi:hypothetical protein